jgi:two-component system response regulator YesN
VEEELNNLKKHFKSKIPVLRQKLLYDILFRINTKKDEILEELNLYGLTIDKFKSWLWKPTRRAGKCKKPV